MVELITLAGRDANINLAMQNQGRRFDVLDECDWRMFGKVIELVPGFALEVIRQKTRDVGSAGKAPEISDARANHGSLETIRMRNHPARHEAAIAPPHHGEMIGVGNTHRDHLI